LNTKSPVTVQQEKIAIKSVGIKKEFNADWVFGQESTQGNFLLVQL
jgi:kinesin family protein C2/C3